jgi:hypothetical protein
MTRARTNRHTADSGRFGIQFEKSASLGERSFFFCQFSLTNWA